MIKERAWPAKAMYILLAAALAISLMIVAAPAQKVSAAPGLSEWTRVDTPTTDSWVLAPCSVIIDYALAEGGEVAYAVVESGFNTTDCDMDEPECYLLKSDDHAATWEDITDALEDVDDDDDIEYLVQVATDWVDPDFVAVALWEDNELRVYFSTDGGDTFEDADWVEDDFYFDDPMDVSDLAVSYEADDERAIAVSGFAYNGTLYRGGLFRCWVEGDSASNWEDAAMDPGWDNMGAPEADITSELVMDIIFSPNWAEDKTILVTTFDDDWDSGSGYGWPADVDDGDIYLQCGSWGTTEGWNEVSTLGIPAVLVFHTEDDDDTALPIWLREVDARAIAGITLPENYDSDDTHARVLWVWVNYYDDGDPRCQITRVDNTSAGGLIGGTNTQVKQGEVWLTNISYKGTIEQGEALAGVLGTGTYDGGPMDIFTDCCEGVQFYRNAGIRDMDICCERWDYACKPPTGRAAMAVSYVGEDKAYAVALWGSPDCCDEGAWSVTFDDGDTWNQLSLIHTFVSYFSDVAVSPDCNKTMLVSVNVEKCCIDYDNGDQNGGPTGCDSVWLHAENLPEAEEYSGQWLRTWTGHLEGDVWVPEPRTEAGMLRLAPEETTGDTVVLFDYYTSNVYLNDLETLACWVPKPSTVLDHIVDLALLDADTFFALDYNGDVAMFDDDEWQEEVDSEVEEGNTIAVWGDWILVGGYEGEVSLSSDGGETFDLVEEIPTINGWVTVAFDTYFDTNMMVYAATFEGPDGFGGGIYSWEIGVDEEWTDLNAEPMHWQIFGGDDDETFEVGYTGLVVDRPGNPYTSPDNGGVIYASYLGKYKGEWVTGVARSLERTIDVCTTCLDWDFLHVGLTYIEEDSGFDEGFNAYPDALKICGCLTPDSDIHLFAIDSWFYDMCENEDGSVWTFEDCYAKKAPTITFPADGEIIPVDPCECGNAPFTVLWDTLCDACSFDIEFAMDEDFTMPVRVLGPDRDFDFSNGYHLPEQDDPGFPVPGGLEGPFSSETTYYLRVRAADAATGQYIHSWWSDPVSFTVAPTAAAGAIELVAPEPGALNQPVENVGFSWNLIATWDAFDWVLSENADLSSPLDSKTGLTSTATGYMGTLDYSTTYYWQVTAYNEGAMVATSAIGTFTTMAEPEEPYIPPEPGTPTWVWIVIAIGAVLVIVVIVLIFRTRRV
jgi:hypothetical protein